MSDEKEPIKPNSPRWKALFPDVRAMLENRGDIYLCPGAPHDRIHGIQIRRHKGISVQNEDGFNPVTTEHWHYYSQYFVIMKVRFTESGRLLPKLAEEMRKVSEMGGLFILLGLGDPIDEIFDKLGGVPGNLHHYIERRMK